MWRKNYTLELGADQEKILRYWTKYAFLLIIYNLPIFSLGNIRTTWGNASTFDAVFGACIGYPSLDLTHFKADILFLYRVHRLVVSNLSVIVAVSLTRDVICI